MKTNKAKSTKKKAEPQALKLRASHSAKARPMIDRIAALLKLLPSTSKSPSRSTRRSAGPRRDPAASRRGREAGAPGLPRRDGASADEDNAELVTFVDEMTAALTAPREKGKRIAQNQARKAKKKQGTAPA